MKPPLCVVYMATRDRERESAQFVEKTNTRLETQWDPIKPPQSPTEPRPPAGREGGGGGYVRV